MKMKLSNALASSLLCILAATLVSGCERKNAGGVALFNHAIRHEWIQRNPITKVRASAKRLREPDVLSPGEFSALLGELELRVQTMVILAGSTGLRRSELVALTWRDIDFDLMQIHVRRSCVRNHFGDTKTEASRKPVPLHASVSSCLMQWRRESPYNGEDDFLFPSFRLNGRQPITRHGAEEGHSTRSHPCRNHA